MGSDRSWSTARRSRRSGSASRFSSSGWWCASGSPPGSSSGNDARLNPDPCGRVPGRLPALVVDDVGEGDAAAGLVRAAQVVRVGRVTEREDVLAVVVLGIAEELTGKVLFVDGRRDAA